ncbi:MAG: ABC transporter substrate-binding protein [Bacteriovoracaceae bacterium]|jgi:ABC-type transport system substrate-binding protein|nr:hypothetical protein [Halobacteriovoraceae bacterium]MDP7319077.1 ABC transporter substrate-binding protein [Bacteriovoracaceae bacterium]
MKKFVTATVISLFIGFLVLYKSTQNNKRQKQINLSVNNIVKSFDPAIAYNDDAMLIMAQVQDSLYQYHYLKRPFEVIPALAEGMPEVSKDGLRYRIKIKKDVYYHPVKGVLPPGRSVIVDDFFWQIKRLAYQGLNSTGGWLFEGKIKGFNQFSRVVGQDEQKFFTEQIEGLKKIDDYTFEIHLNRPDPNIIYFLSMHFTTPVPLELIRFYKNDLSEVLIGTGPYIYKGLHEGAYLLTRNKNYREEFYPTSGDRYANTENLLKSSRERLPFASKVIFKIIYSVEERWKKFMDGEVDILTVPKDKLASLATPGSALSQELKKNGIIIKHFSRQTTRWLGFNMQDKIVGKNLNLRKAIAHAINYDEYISTLTYNTNLKSNSIFNPSIKGYRPSHRLPYSYDIQKAKRYLRQAGYAPGELTLTYSTRGKHGVHLDEANFIKKQLERIGINLKIDKLNFSDFLKLGRSGKLQFWTDNWIYDYPDAENLLQLLISKNHPGINKSGYSNLKVDKLYQKLSTTLDEKERFFYMYKIEDYVEADLPWIMLMYESTYILQRESILNFRKSFFIRNFVKYLKRK